MNHAMGYLETSTRLADLVDPVNPEKEFPVNALVEALLKPPPRRNKDAGAHVDEEPPLRGHHRRQPNHRYRP